MNCRPVSPSSVVAPASSVIRAYGSLGSKTSTRCLAMKEVMNSSSAETVTKPFPSVKVVFGACLST